MQQNRTEESKKQEKGEKGYDGITFIKVYMGTFLY